MLNFCHTDKNESKIIYYIYLLVWYWTNYLKTKNQDLTKLKVVGVDKEIWQVVKFWYELSDITHIVFRGRFPHFLYAVEHSLRNIKWTILHIPTTKKNNRHKITIYKQRLLDKTSQTNQTNPGKSSNIGKRNSTASDSHSTLMVWYSLVEVAASKQGL